jgi:hypothetical protein
VLDETPRSWAADALAATIIERIKRGIEASRDKLRLSL